MVFLEFTERSQPSKLEMIKYLLFPILLFSLFSCGNIEEAEHRTGEITIYVEPSNKNLMDALSEIYQMKYPKTEFNFVYKPENEILKDLLDTVAYAAFINQPLSEEQADYINLQTKIHPRSTLLAHDAVIFITDIDNPIDSISLDEIEDGILNNTLQIVFDNGNSGNFNTVKNKLELEIPEGKTIQALDNADSIIEFVQKSKSSIGVIGLNEISETDDPRVKEILTKIKVLSIVDEEGKVREPSIPNILGLKYPFSKQIYFILVETGFGIGNGFSRFAGSQQGQLVVKRAGLQPHYLYDREIQINLESVE